MSAPPQLDRRLAAVWFADVVGFTSLADTDEDAALEAALALSASFSGSGDPGATAIRIGLHVGEVASTPDGDVYGDGVNLASRLQSVAAPGEAVVSEDAEHPAR